MTAIRLNGADRELTSGTTVTEVVALLTATDRGCAVAVNDEVVPRHAWSDHVLADGDRVEVLTAVQGG
jgi:sulfur carrier protein